MSGYVPQVFCISVREEYCVARSVVVNKQHTAQDQLTIFRVLPGKTAVNRIFLTADYQRLVQEQYMYRTFLCVHVRTSERYT